MLHVILCEICWRNRKRPSNVYKWLEWLDGTNKTKRFENPLARIILIALLISVAVSASTETGSNNANKHEHANDKHLKAAQEGHKKHNGQELMPDETPENNDQAEKPIPAVTNNNSLTNGKRGRRQRINHQHGKGKRNNGSAHIHTQSDSNANKSARKHARSKSHSTVDSERLSKQHRKQGRGKQAN
ncbi:uncharacterized protein ACN2A1_000308 isoform 1-T1 [Glossina fuscipes fuscipes]